MKKLIMSIIGIFVCLSVYSQTAYQNKCSQIFMKYWKIFTLGKQMTQGDRWAMEYIGTYEKAKDYLKVASLNYLVETGRDPDVLLKQMEKEYEAAKSLMTKQEKTEYRIDEERKTNFGRVKWDAVLVFLKWADKGEYEKTEDYIKRLTNESHPVYDSIMYHHIKLFMKDNPWTFQYESYNADKEKLYVKFYDKIGENSWGHYIDCPPAEAEKIKRACEPQEYPIYDEGDFKLQMDCDLEFYYDLSNVLTDGKDFIADKFYIDSYFGNFVLSNKVDGIFEIQIKYDELRLQDLNIVALDKYMKGHIFNYKQYVANNRERELLARKEQAIRDSIAKREKFLKDSLDYIKYSKMIDSVYNECNHDLEVDEYNVKNYRITSKATISPSNPKASYDEVLDKIRDERHQKKMEIKSFHDKCWNEYGNGNYFQTLNDFDKYFCKGLDTLDAEIDLRIITKFIDKNSYKVDQIDFRKPKTNSFIAEYLDAQKDYSDINTMRETIMDAISKCKGKYIYELAIDYLIFKNGPMRADYYKNGSKFSSKAEFYEAYTSGYYKQHLKLKK